MRHWIRESLRTVAVTTYHPVGWGLDRVQSAFLRNAMANEDTSRAEHCAPVVLVHGIFHNASAFHRFERVLGREGFRNLSTLELWTSIQSLEKMAEELKRFVRRALARCAHANPLGRARIVAHSLGGMVTRVALLDPDFASLVDKVVFLGVPHGGNFFFRFPFPPCIRDLRSGSKLFARLRDEPLPGQVHYWNLRGGLDLVAKSQATFLPHVPNLIFDGIGHAGLLHDRNVIRTVVRILEAPFAREAAVKHG